MLKVELDTSTRGCGFTVRLRNWPHVSQGWHSIPKPSARDHLDTECCSSQASLRTFPVALLQGTMVEGSGHDILLSRKVGLSWLMNVKMTNTE